jgi:hypothetical protein
VDWHGRQEDFSGDCLDVDDLSEDSQTPTLVVTKQRLALYPFSYFDPMRHK